MGDGVLAGALGLTTEHVRTREQFGRPLAIFQAVAQQIAEVYIAARTMHLAAATVNWQLANNKVSAADSQIAGVLARGRAPACTAGVPAPARRARRRHHLPAAPLLLARQGPRPSRRRPRRAPRTDRRVHIELSDEQRALQASCMLFRVARHARTRRARCSSPGMAPPIARSCGGWAATVGSGSVGRPSSVAAASASSSRRSSSTKRRGSDIPLPYVTLQTVGPVLQRYGTQEQKDLFLAAHPRRRPPLRDRLHRACPQAPTSPTCGRRLCATVTSTS